VALATAAAVGLQAVGLLSPGVAEVDPEELYNAGVAWMLGHGHAEAVFRMQYREFCGGCSLDAALGAPLLMVFGPRWLAWKLVPLGFTALLAAAGTWLLDRKAGRPTAVTFAILLALAPRAWQHLSLIGWGNHVEAAVVGTLGLLIALSAERAWARVAAGAVLGAAVWIGFSGAFAPLAAVGLLLVRRQPRAAAQVALGVPLGLLPWVAQYASTGLHPFVTIYQDGESAPTLQRIPHKLKTLLAPGQLVALFGLPRRWVGHLHGWAAAISIAVALVATLRDRGRGLAGVGLAGLGAWTAVYLLVRFQIYDPAWPEIAVPGSVRYAAPIYPLLMLVLAGTAGRWWAAGGRARAVALLLPAGLAGAAARIETAVGAVSPARIAGLGAVHWQHFRPQFSYTLPDAVHAASAGEDRWSRRAHAYALGRNDAGMKLRNPQDGTLARVRLPAGVLAGPWWEGVGEALVDQLDDETQDTRELLRRADLLLDGAPGVDETGRARALRAAAWARREAGDQPALEPGEQAHWRAEAAPPGAAAALSWAHARALGEARVGWHGDVPAGLVEEALAASCPGEGCGASVEGLALGMGVELGPIGMQEVSAPAGESEAWQRGLDAAWALWWPDEDTF
jgi:hypothetical protein